MPAIRVLVVDDNASFRKHLREFLDTQAGLLVVGEASDGEQGIVQAKQLKPDIVLMDVRMDGLNGLSATRLLKTAEPDIAVLVLSHFDLQEYRDAAVSSGASGYVTKRSLFTDLLPAIYGAVRVR